MTTAGNVGDYKLKANEIPLKVMALYVKAICDNFIILQHHK